MAEKVQKADQVNTDWGFGWDTSLPVKITSIVLWGLVVAGFALTVLLAKSESDLVERNESNADRIAYVALHELESGGKIDSVEFLQKMREVVAKVGVLGVHVLYDGKEVTVGVLPETPNLAHTHVMANGKLSHNKPVRADHHAVGDHAEDGHHQSNAPEPDHTQDQDMDLRIRENILDDHPMIVEVFHEDIKVEVNWRKSRDLIYVVVFCIIFGLALTAVMRVVVTVPIRKILVGTSKVTLDNFEVNLDIARKDEIGQLSNFITDMLARLKDQQEEISKKIVLQTRAEEASKAKSMFLANMSHEIRTPMNAVLGYAQILRKDPTLSKEHRRTIEIIERSGIHLLGVINDILDFSKIEAGQMELTKKDFDLGGCINDIAMMFAIRCQEKKLQWISETDDARRAVVRGDEGKLRQVIINLISNAIKFTNAGGVTLKVSRSDEKNQFLFSVSDTGFGIADDERDRIFRPFQQTESGTIVGGTGLGISIAKRYVEMMGGVLDFRSKLGEGTTFYFSAQFDEAVELVRAPVQDKVPSKTVGEKLSALVLDDDPVNRDVLARMLDSVGVSVIQAENGREALDKIQQFSVPDILFIDIEMPVMGGREFVQEFKSTYGVRGKLVATTATTMWEQEDHNRFDLLVTKPYNAELVYGLVEEVANLEYRRDDLCVTESSDQSKIQAVVLPENLRDKLKAAAELYEITEVKQILEKIAFLGNAEKIWAERVLEYVQAYDMDSIIKILIESESNAD